MRSMFHLFFAVSRSPANSLIRPLKENCAIPQAEAVTIISLQMTYLMCRKQVTACESRLVEHGDREAWIMIIQLWTRVQHNYTDAAG